MQPATDVIDELLAAWKLARPDLDPQPLAVVGRVLVLAKHLERRVESALKKHKLTLGQFDILATLRRNDKQGGLTPTALLKSVVLSSGGMTNRLDKLEQAGLIQRQPDPTDRRGTVVTLTARGKKLIDAATETRFADAEAAQPPLDEGQLVKLEDLLRVWLNSMTAEGTKTE